MHHLALVLLCSVLLFLVEGEIGAREISSADQGLTLDNGVFHLHGEPLDGVIVERYPNGEVKRRTSYSDGKKEGRSVSFYESGARRDERTYRSNKAHGPHRGWWPEGGQKFEFNYRDDSRDGVQRQWYRSGALFTELILRDDVEVGMQRAFRENGRAYINYEAKAGRRYGLAKSALCVQLEDGSLK
jgi:antitoxin component YwqK of YwqJK toxin-antitoxin module